MLRRYHKPICGRERARKALLITNILQQNSTDSLDMLRRLALQEGGFLSSHIRSRVWPVLLNVPSRPSDDPCCAARPQEHRDNRQVDLDVNRSLSHFGLTEVERQRLLPRLTQVVNSVMAMHPELYYYQVANIAAARPCHTCEKPI